METNDDSSLFNELNELRKNRSNPVCNSDDSNGNPLREKYAEIIIRLADKKLNMGADDVAWELRPCLHF